MTAMTEQSPSLDEYVDEAGFVWLQRCHAVSAPHYDRQQFADLDDHLAAQLDALKLAPAQAWPLCEKRLENTSPEDFFVAGVLALEDLPSGHLAGLIGRARSAPEAVPGLMSALGWVSHRKVADVVTALLSDSHPLPQKLGLAACGFHRHDPGAALQDGLASRADSVRVRALRVAGELGRLDLLPVVVQAVDDAKPEIRFWAARSAALLGDRQRAVAALITLATSPGLRQMPALQTALQLMNVEAGHALLKQAQGLPDLARMRVIGAGFSGDPMYASWLIEQATNAATARIALEAFVSITGVDVNAEQLESMPPADHEDGPSEDPDDENVELPEDIALPWPDVERLKTWWSENRSRFSAGQKLFLGQPVTAEHCTHVLKTGFQRQRVIAAHYRSLLQPGTPLFPTSAPAWRQQRLLDTL